MSTGPGTDGSAPADMVMAHGADLAPTMSGCDPTKVILCEGFETDLSRWASILNMGTVTIDTTHVYSGKSALKAHTDAVASGGANAAIASSAGLPASDYFVRAWIYVPSGFDNTPVTLSDVAQNGPTYHAVNLQLEQNGLSTYNSLVGSVYHGVAGTVARDTWTCVEWEARFGSSGAVNVWLDDSALTAISLPDDLSGSPAPSQLQLGIASEASGTAARDLWLDDVVVNSSRIGCQ
jgi:hypothetical protein